MQETKGLKRFPCDVPGLDQILGGGMFEGRIYLVAGRPGLGKTILANQVAYGHAAEGGSVVYVTLLAESHARLMLSLEQMSFFKPELVGRSLHYLSGFKSLEGGKLDGLMEMLRKVLRDHKATLLVLDGLVTAGALAQSPVELKLFVHELQVVVELMGSTCMLLTGGEEHDADSYAQRTMVDGIIVLSPKRVGLQTVREIEIQKHRGSNQVWGASFYEISSKGIRIFPRTEATLGLRATDQGNKPPIPMATGIDGLDSMMNGGFQRDSMTMVLGTPGSGKTLVGLSFLAAGAKKSESGLYVGFFESSSRIETKARSIGLDLRSQDQSGGVEVQWHAPQEQLADRLAEELLERISERKVKRLFIDGLAGFRRGVIYPERMGPFFTSLSNELRARGVTTIVSEEANGLFEPRPDIPSDGTTAIMDSILLLKYTQTASKLVRQISLIKMRNGHYDSSLGELRITGRGLAVVRGSEGVGGQTAKKSKVRPGRRG